MSTIVNDGGFNPDVWVDNGGNFIDLEKYGQDVVNKDPSKTALDIPNHVEVKNLVGLLDQVAMIRISFPSFADGRGFSLAMQLRQAGFKGRLRAVGHIIADQYGFARTCGFDEVEIDEALAKRQPQEQWLARIPNDELSYQKKLLVKRT